MGKLHELLAVEQSLRGASVQAMSEANTTFTKRGEHFDGVLRVYSPKDDDGEQLPKEEKAIVTTVDEKLDFMATQVTPCMDAVISKEMTNSSGAAKAELELSAGKKVMLSATALLALESQLTELRSVYKNLPTLDPARVWTNDPDAGVGYKKTETEVRFRTIKKAVPVTLAEPTEHHPAQVQLVNRESQVGQYDTVYTSAKITPAEKSARLTRLDRLIRRVKKARVKANQVEAEKTKIGKDVFDFINKG